MSNTLAIAAVTETLRKIIQDALGQEEDVGNAIATVQPPDKPDSTRNLINIFLYQTSVNGAWSNMDMPRQVKPNETGQPPLALSLSYLLTAYSLGDDLTNAISHRLLGRAMRALHDHPVLSADDIKGALDPADVQKFDLYEQVEHVRITPQPLSMDEMSKLWAMFQSKYRISTAYQASVVLIESTRQTKTPLPVLRRGPQDQGVDTQANLTSPFPTLTALAFETENQPVFQPGQKKPPSFQLGQKLTLSGHHLNGDSLVARFNNPRLANPIEINLPAVATTETTTVSLTIPDDALNQERWVAGFYTVALDVIRNNEPVNKKRTTNELSFSLAPHILTRVPTSRAAAAGDFTLTVTCSPRVRPEQRATLLFGGSEYPADEHLLTTDTLTFRIQPITNASVGQYFLRLRVDGVDSLLVLYTKTPPEFDQNQKVTLT